MLDQAERLRKLAKEAEKRSEDLLHNKGGPKIVTVTSGKGGVGKSNFVVNIAIALQKIGKKVLILDADMGMANDDILMGFLPKYDIGDIMFNNMDLESVIIEGPFGVKLLPGGSGIQRLDYIEDNKRDDFIKKIEKLEDLDFVIMDTGAGANKMVFGFIACCEELIVITTPEPTSLTDAYSLLKIVNSLNLKASVQLVINKALNSHEAVSTYNKFSNTVNKFLNIKLNYLGFMLDDNKVEAAVRKQSPFILSFPNSNASKSVISMANKMVGAKEECNLGIQGFFKRIFKNFS